VVMSEGRIVHECLASDADMAQIGQHMAGARSAPSLTHGAP
jgi:hypothetical protein